MKTFSCGLLLVLVLLSGKSDADTATCVSCDSKLDADCASEIPGALLTKTSQCSDITKGCYIELYDESVGDKPGKYVKRDCVSNRGNAKCETPNVCEVCLDPADCNTAKFPANRLQCQKGLSGTSEDCAILPLNPATEGCVTLYNDDSTLKDKGCFTDLDKPTRDQCLDANVFTCSHCFSGDSCNTETSWAGNYCYSCSGKICNEPDESTNTVRCEAGTSPIPKSTDCQMSWDVSSGQVVRKCLSPQESLCSGNSRCQSCKGLKCNGGVFPANRLTCLKCSGSDCSNPLKSSICDTIQTNDQCVTTFNDDGTILQKGCKSDLTDDKKIVCNSLTNINCIKCDGNDCNTEIERIGNNCYKCTGATCLQPNVPSVTCLKDSEGKSDCYTEINANGDLVKDCKVLPSCSLSKTCEICPGNLCNNKQIFPEDRLTCHKCSGANCQSPSTSSVCETYLADDTCITSYNGDGSIASKDCLSKLTADSKAICNDQSNYQCSKCSTNDCNENMKREGNTCYKCSGPDCLSPTQTQTTACLAGTDGKSIDCYTGLDSNGEIVRDCQQQIADGKTCEDSKTCDICSSSLCNKEIYPENRLSCHKCEGNSCASSTTSSYCLKHDPQDKCATAFKSDGSVEQKGCYSEFSTALKATCDLTTNINCRTCNIKDCNEAINTRDNNYCYKCVGPDCLEPESQVLCLGGDGKSSECYSDIDTNGDIVRGCKNDHPDLAACIASTLCTTCSDELCNLKIVPDNRLKCHKCSESSCLETTDASKYCNKYLANDECVTSFNDDGSILKRSCYSELDASQKAVCDVDTNINCIKSSDSGNTQTKRIGNNCYKCEGAECVNPKAEHSVVCLAGTDEKSTSCYTGINGDGVIIRDCQKDILDGTTCLENKICDICEENLCNKNKFPKTQLSCYQCEGAACLTTTVPADCQKIDVNDVCVTIFEGSTVLKKACLSSLTETESNNCQSNSPSCLTCREDGCNSANTKDEETCIQCNSLQDPNCAQYPSKLTSRACPSPGGNQCFSKVYGANTIRGCKATLDLEICEGEECNLCTGNSCNNKVYPGNRLTCYHCEDNKDCAEEQKDATKNYPCLAYKKEDACVWITTDGSVTRKCLSDVEKCDFPDCNSCKGNGCNKNNSSLLQINTILLTIFFVISCSAFKSF